MYFIARRSSLRYFLNEIGQELRLSLALTDNKAVTSESHPFTWLRVYLLVTQKGKKMQNKAKHSGSFLRLPQIIGNPKANPPVPPLIPIKKSTLWAWVKANKFVSPIKIGDRVTVWRSEDVEQWMREQIERNQNGREAL